VADLGDANLTPYFGPVLEAIDQAQTTYAALVVYVGAVIDTWSLVVMDLASMRGVVIDVELGHYFTPVLMRRRVFFFFFSLLIYFLYHRLGFATDVYTISPPEQGLNAETDSPFGLGFDV
jgi:hypothetical protein